ncbi:hypothetical protein SprV_0100314100 [Sparganum proliferum]
MDADLDLSEAESIDANDVVIKYSDKSPVTDHERIATEPKSSAKKPKREVDVRASKGRKIRYLKIPKAVDFMFPQTFFHERSHHWIFAKSPITLTRLHSYTPSLKNCGEVSCLFTHLEPAITGELFWNASNIGLRSDDQLAYRFARVNNSALEVNGKILK